MKLFVYGSLKQGFWNNTRLNGAKFLGPALTKKNYTLMAGGFPYAVTADVGHKQLPIMGEVFEIDEGHLARCDALEGHPNWYRRDTIKVTMLSGEEEDVMIYEWNSPLNQRVCDVVEDKYYHWLG